MQTQGHRYKENPETSDSFLVRQALSGIKPKLLVIFGEKTLSVNVKKMADRSRLLEKIGTEQIFPTVDAAVQHFRS